MNHEPLVSIPSANRQPENNGPSSTGHEWNNGITRRIFLKRTGGATIGTIITWNLGTNTADAKIPEAGQSGNYVWSVTYELKNAKVVLLTKSTKGMSNSQIVEMALPGLYNDGNNDHDEAGRVEKNTPGTVLDPYLYSVVSGSPTVNVPQVEFPAKFIFKVTFRKKNK